MTINTSLWKTGNNLWHCQIDSNSLMEVAIFKLSWVLTFLNPSLSAQQMLCRYSEEASCHTLPFCIWAHLNVFCSGKLASSYACFFCSSTGWTALFLGEAVCDKRPEDQFSQTLLSFRADSHENLLTSLSTYPEQTQVCYSGIQGALLALGGVKFTENYQRCFFVVFCFSVSIVATNSYF